MQNRHKLSLKNLSVKYKAGRKDLSALDKVSLNIKKGEFVSIVGPSGCGKTTLLYCINGLVRPNSGTILIDGGPIGTVFQSSSLLPWRKVLGNIVYGLEVNGVSKAERDRIGYELISMVGLKGFESFYPHQLSGGMRQRVNLARALAINPQILLMDEPFASLDAQTREQMQVELLNLWQKNQKTVLFVTHQIDEAVYLSDRVVVLSNRPGKVKKIVNVNINRPRDIRVKMSTGFIQLQKQIWTLIMEEVR